MRAAEGSRALNDGTTTFQANSTGRISCESFDFSLFALPHWLERHWPQLSLCTTI